MDSLRIPGHTLPGHYFTDEAHFQKEMERYFLARWFCAGRADQVSSAGDYFLCSIGRESLIVTRDRDGRLGAFHNLCRHRGTRLCTDERGHLPGHIQCPYHAWTYALDGQLIGAPHMEAVPGFDRADHGLRPVHLDVWDGHVFLHLGASPPPLAAQLGDLVPRFRDWEMETLRLGHRITYEVRANWKLVILNFSECLHCPVIHPQVQRISHYLTGENEPPRPGWIGGRMELRPGVETMSRDGLRRRALLPRVSEDDRRRVYYYAVLPNLLLSLHPDFVLVHRLLPHGAGATDVICEWYFHPDALAKDEAQPGDVVEFWDETNRQDWRVSELSQLGIASSAYRPGPYSTREELLEAFDRMVADAIEPTSAG